MKLLWKLRANESVKPTGRTILVISGASGCCSLAGVFLVGLPGALILQVFLRATGAAPQSAVKPDAAWPIALLLSVLAPWGAPLGYVAVGRRWFLVAILEVLWLCALCFLFVKWQQLID